MEHGLDLAPFYDGYTEARGAPPYEPRLMVKLLIFGYSNGVTSSRELERRCHHDVAFMFLSAQAGLVSLGRIALDGSKVRASATRHRAMTYDRMVRAEGELAAEVQALLADAERTDAAEDLEAEHASKARVNAEQAAAKRGAGEAEQAAAGERAESTGVVPGKAQRSFTDPDARIMKTSGGSFHYCYNAQTVVDEGSQVILSTALVASGADSPELPGALAGLADSLAAAGIEGLPRTLLADAGYFSAGNVTAVTEAGIDPLIATGRQKHGEKAPAAPRGRIPKGLTLRQRMTRTLHTKRGRADYTRRKAIVEPVFG